MSKHLNTCSGTEKEIHVCDTCNKTFQFKCRLKLHLETHEVDSDKVCLNCGRRYKRSDFFQNHVAICSSKPSSEVSSVSKEIKNRTCPICDRKFKRLDFFNKHVEKCSSDPPFPVSAESSFADHLNAENLSAYSMVTLSNELTSGICCNDESSTIAEELHGHSNSDGYEINLLSASYSDSYLVQNESRIEEDSTTLGNQSPSNNSFVHEDVCQLSSSHLDCCNDHEFTPTGDHQLSSNNSSLEIEQIIIKITDVGNRK